MKKSSTKNVKNKAIAGVILLMAALIILTGCCKIQGCNNIAASGSEYCKEHKCKIDGCPNYGGDSAGLDGYCYEHYMLYH